MMEISRARLTYARACVRACIRACVPACLRAGGWVGRDGWSTRRKKHKCKVLWYPEECVIPPNQSRTVEPSMRAPPFRSILQYWLSMVSDCLVLLYNWCSRGCQFGVFLCTFSTGMNGLDSFAKRGESKVYNMAFIA